jgi:hypothetical protein
MGGSVGVRTKLVSSGLLMALDAADPLSYVSGSTSWADVSFNGNNSTLVNGVSYSAANLGSLTFNGTNQYVSTLTMNGLSTFTISMWFRTTSSGTGGVYWQHPQLFGKSNGGGTSGDFGIHVVGGNIGYWTGLSNPDSSWSGVSVNNNVWRHVAVVANGSSTVLYLNGSLQAGSSLSVVRGLNGEAFWIGGKGGSEVPGSYLACSISQVLVYNTALTAPDVLQNFNSTRWRFGV